MKSILYKFICLIVVFAPFSATSQISNGTIRYAVNADAFVARGKKNNATKNSSRKSIFETMAKEMHRIQLVLSFKSARSVFYRKPGLALDNSEKVFRLAVAFADRGTYYTDIKEKKLLIYREYQGEVMLVDSSLKDVDWELTSDQKKIGGFTCYKALSNVETHIGKLPITAWYSPDVPVAFGPVDYGGTLPGLILELHTNELSFICEEINLNVKDDITIDWPNADTAITPEEYKKMNEDLAKALRRN